MMFWDDLFVLVVFAREVSNVPRVTVLADTVASLDENSMTATLSSQESPK